MTPVHSSVISVNLCLRFQGERRQYVDLKVALMDIFVITMDLVQ